MIKISDKATPINVIKEICKISEINKCGVEIPIALSSISDVLNGHDIKNALKTIAVITYKL